MSKDKQKEPEEKDVWLVRIKDKISLHFSVAQARAVFNERIKKWEYFTLNNNYIEDTNEMDAICDNNKDAYKYLKKRGEAEVEEATVKLERGTKLIETASKYLE